MFGGKGFKSEFKKPSDDKKKKMTELMAKCNLKSSALYKTFTVDVTKSIECQPAAVALPPLDPFIIQMIRDPLPISSDLARNVLSKLKEYENSLSPEVMKFYNEKVRVTELKCNSIFQETLDQASCPQWYQYRQYRVTASVAREINNARSEKTRYQHFTG